MPAIVRSIEVRLGGIDVAIYAPVTPEGRLRARRAARCRAARAARQQFLFAPIELAHALVPSLVARGGAFILGGGLTAIVTMPA